MLTGLQRGKGGTGRGGPRAGKIRNIRVIFPMYTSYFHMYALRKSGIGSITDLNDEARRGGAGRRHAGHLLALDP